MMNQAYVNNHTKVSHMRNLIINNNIYFPNHVKMQMSKCNLFVLSKELLTNKTLFIVISSYCKQNRSLQIYYLLK